MKGLLIALGFLTRLPVPGRDKVDGKTLGKSSLYFPLAGLILGGFLVLANLGLSRFLPPRLASLGILILLALLTGGLHLDGLADTVDAFASKSRDRETLLAIMRDSRIGAMGVLALVLVLLLKYELLTALPPDVKNKALILMCVLSRWSLTSACFLSHYARSSGGLGRAFVDYTGRKEFILSTLFTLLIAGIFYFPAGTLFVLAAFIITFLLTKYIESRIAGLTGDILGAINEVIEISTLTAIILLEKIV